MTEITDIKNENDITINSINIKKIITEYHNFFASKFYNLHKMDKFFEIHKVPKSLKKKFIT